jgi:hypothetical protein
MLGRPNNLNTLYISKKNFKFNTMDNQQETKNNTLFCKL